MAAQQTENTFQPGSPIWAFLQYLYPLGATKVAVELISTQRTHEARSHDPWEFKIAPVGGKASQDKDGFTFEECAYRYGEISICRYQRFK